MEVIFSNYKVFAFRDHTDVLYFIQCIPSFIYVVLKRLTFTYIKPEHLLDFYFMISVSALARTANSVALERELGNNVSTPTNKCTY